MIPPTVTIRVAHGMQIISLVCFYAVATMGFNALERGDLWWSLTCVCICYLNGSSFLLTTKRVGQLKNFTSPS